MDENIRHTLGISVSCFRLECRSFPCASYPFSVCVCLVLSVPGYDYLVDDEDEDNGDKTLDFADDPLGPEDGEGDVDELNVLGFAAF